jgi:hypothetical protein
MPRLARRIYDQLQAQLYVDLGPSSQLLPQEHLWTGRANDLLLWILLCGYFGSGHGPDAVWFGDSAITVSKLLRLDVNKVENLLHSFVYLPRLQAAGIFQLFRSTSG